MAEKKEEDSKSLSADKQEISISAYLALKKGQYDSSIINLKKLQKNHPGDFKLMHNRAIAEFYKSGQTKTSDLKKNLAKVKSQFFYHNCFCLTRHSKIILHRNLRFIKWLSSATRKRMRLLKIIHLLNIPLCTSIRPCYISSFISICKYANV